MSAMTTERDFLSKSDRGGSSHYRGRASLRGFTIVELILVITVIGILAAISVIGYGNWRQSVTIGQLKSDLNGAAAAMEASRNFGNTYPTTVPSSFVPSNGVVLGGGATNGGLNYCVAATNNGTTYHITDTTSAAVGPVAVGICTGVMANGTVCPSGFIVIPGSSTYGTSDFCAMKYAASQASAIVPASQAAAVPWVNISQTTSLLYSPNVVGCTGCHLITDPEWLTIAQNVMSVAGNWSGGSVGNGSLYVGHTDNAPSNSLVADTNDSNGYAGETNTGGNQRRTLTLTNGEVIWDLSGNVNSWTQSTIAPGQTPGVPGGGASWVDYNNPTLNLHGMPASSVPSYANSAASSWSNTQGLGKIYGDYASATTWAYMRGCYYGADLIPSPHCGVFTLYLALTPTSSSSGEGFRVTK